MVGISVSSKQTKIMSAITAISVALALMLSSTASGLTIGGPSDCDSNAIIRCGTHSTSNLMNTYQQDTYVRRVFHMFNIGSNDMAKVESNAVAGTVTRSGKVLVDGKTVATGAMTGGRQDMPGSTKDTWHGSTVFKRPPSVSFQSSSLPAFVVMDNGQFQFAVIASCGNPVTATPVQPEQPQAAAPEQPAEVTPAAAPTPPPAPAPVQQQQQQQQAVIVNQAPPAPAAPAPPAPAPPQPQPESQPVSLPATGPASAAGLFALSVAGGMYGYRRFLSSRL